jgi:hypothetical protein
LTCGVGSAGQHEHRQLGSHEHGVGQLNVAQENETLNIELISPAVNIVGFEHAPANPEQEDAVQSATKTLRDGARVFSLPAEAQCQLAKAEVETDIEGEHDEGKHEGEHEGEDHDGDKHAAHEGEDEHDEEVHSEFHVSYAFSCAKPSALTHIDVNLFTLFSGTEELQVQVISEQGQTKVKLTSGSARIEL